MSSTVIILIVVLLVILVAFYAFAILMRKKTEDRILALEERKESLFDLPVQEEIDSVKKCISSDNRKQFSVNGTKNGLTYHQILLLIWKNIF